MVFLVDNPIPYPTRNSGKFFHSSVFLAWKKEILTLCE